MRRRVAVFYNKPYRGKIIKECTKKEGNIIYGARSIQAQLGLISRETEDYDIFSKNPKKSANKTEKKLDKSIGFDYYYTEPAMHPGTYKVKTKGYDMKKGTKDDEGIADYTTTPKPKPKVKVIGGLMYRDLKEEIAAKKRSLADKQYAFRHPKDQRDLTIIRTSMAAKQPMRRKIPNYYK